MATKRRSPGTLPPTLTPKQQADADRCFPIGVNVAMYYVRREPEGLTDNDLLSAANEAVVLAVCTHASNVALESYVWARVRSTLKTLIRRTAERLGLRAPNDTPASRVADAGSEALNEYALTVEDRGNIWKDSRAQQIEQYDDEARNGATALVTGGGGHVWHMRGEEGLVLRADYVRTNKVLHDEVARLPPEHATVVELRFFRELPRRDVAREAGVSESKVARLIGEAIPLLKARLEARGIKDLSMLDGR
jgi:RNA polymerase sigma factor (sigma-70 family)